MEILKNPQVGDVIPGTGRLRKMRFALKNEGKRGSARICHVDFPEIQTIYLIAAYPKSKKDNLSQKECQEIKKLIEVLERLVKD